MKLSFAEDAACWDVQFLNNDSMADFLAESMFHRSHLMLSQRSEPMMNRRLLLSGFAFVFLFRLAGAEDRQLAGQVLDDLGKPVPRTHVIAFDQVTGVPAVLGKKCELDFTNLAYAITDEQGRFAITEVPVGAYKLIAQSWDNADNRVKNPLMDRPNYSHAVLRLRGIVEKVEVPSTKATALEFRPLGNATLFVITDPVAPNTETLLAVSRSPLAADPALGLAGWAGDFSTNMIAGNRMPFGQTMIHGLPIGRLHVATFSLDNSPGFGGKVVEMNEGTLTYASVPFVAGWSDAKNVPPVELAPLITKVRDMGRKQILALLEEQLPDVVEKIKQTEDDDPISFMLKPVPFLTRQIKLPDGTEVLYKDLMAACAYATFTLQPIETTPATKK